MELEKSYNLTIKNLLLTKFKIKSNKLILNLKLFIFFKKLGMSLIAYIVLIILTNKKLKLIYNIKLSIDKPIGFSSIINNFLIIQKIVILFLGVSRELILNYCNINNKNYLLFLLKYDFTDLFELFSISHIYSDGIEDLIFFFKFSLINSNIYYNECFFRLFRFPILLKTI